METDNPDIRESTDSLATDLHKTFAAWVQDKGLYSPTKAEWKSGEV